MRCSQLFVFILAFVLFGDAVAADNQVVIPGCGDQVLIDAHREMRKELSKMKDNTCSPSIADAFGHFFSTMIESRACKEAVGSVGGKGKFTRLARGGWAVIACGGAAISGFDFKDSVGKQWMKLHECEPLTSMARKFESECKDASAISFADARTGEVVCFDRETSEALLYYNYKEGVLRFPDR